jgi:ABC-type nickel/cobalt efflux system permease component RcnA
MKYGMYASRALVALLAALTFAPVSVYARDAEPVARTKPVIDHAQQHEKVARREHEHHHRAAHHDQRAHKQAQPR